MAQRNTAAVRPQGFEPVKGGATLLDVFQYFFLMSFLRSRQTVTEQGKQEREKCPKFDEGN
jgi:hypothetical protein